MEYKAIILVLWLVNGQLEGVDVDIRTSGDCVAELKMAESKYEKQAQDAGKSVRLFCQNIE